MSSQTPPPAPAPSPAQVDTPKKLWHVGTLTYTSAGIIALFLWLLWGDFAWWMKERAVVPVGQLMLRQFGASDFLVGLLVGSVPAALGLILGPIISVKSDNHRGPRGRRIPYLIVSTPFVAVSMFGLAGSGFIGDWFNTALGASSPGQVACRLLAFGFFWTIFEIFQTIVQAIFYGLINDVVPSAVIGRFFGLFRAVSLFAGIIFNFWLIGYSETHYVAICLGLGVLFGVGFTMMCFMVKEGEYPPPPPPGPNLTVSRRVLDPVKAYFKECYTHPYYRWVFMAYTFGNIAFAPVNSFSVFYAKSLGMNMDQYGKLLVISFCVSLVISYTLGSLADKYHPIRLGVVSLAAYAATMLWGGSVATTPALFSIAFVTHAIISGIFYTGTASLGQRLYPRAKFAQFFSAAGLVASIGFITIPPMLGAFLDATGRVYRHSMYLGSGVALLGAIIFFMVWQRYQKLGGDKGYSPPA